MKLTMSYILFNLFLPLLVDGSESKPIGVQLASSLAVDTAEGKIPEKIERLLSVFVF